MKTSLVVTTINPPNEIMRKLAIGAVTYGWDFIVIGDKKTPNGWTLPGAIFLDVTAQEKLPFRFAEACPKNHYTRKNIGYLMAMRDGADIIVETDDDNSPLENFWLDRHTAHEGLLYQGNEFFNFYTEFTDENIWPRGIPITRFHRDTMCGPSGMVYMDCHIQQGVVNGDPDVDAIWRLTQGKRIKFRPNKIITTGSLLCPINSQNTTWFKSVFPLMYMPATCNNRLTDIWRGFIADAILKAHGGNTLFHGPSMEQFRNEHSLKQDFIDEIPLHTQDGFAFDCRALASRELSFRGNMLHIYKGMVKLGHFLPEEIPLLELWLEACP